MKDNLTQIQQSMIAQIQEFYEQVHSLLTSEESYDRKVDIRKVELLFQLAEGTLERPFNRLAHVDSFLRDPDGLMVNKMSPFAFLLPDVAEQIKDITNQVSRLAESHTLLYPDSEKELYQEPHEIVEY